MSNTAAMAAEPAPAAALTTIEVIQDSAEKLLDISYEEIKPPTLNDTDRALIAEVVMDVIKGIDANKLHNRIGRGIKKGAMAVGQGAKDAWEAISSEEAKALYGRIGNALILNMNDPEGFVRTKLNEFGQAVTKLANQVNDYFKDQKTMGGKAVAAIKKAFKEFGESFTKFFEELLGPTLAAKGYEIADKMQDVAVKFGRYMEKGPLLKLTAGAEYGKESLKNKLGTQLANLGHKLRGDDTQTLQDNSKEIRSSIKVNSHFKEFSLDEKHREDDARRKEKRETRNARIAAKRKGKGKGKGPTR
ncbi:MAG: hypothetical protein K0T99_00855 [Alphaproteobacteria bacterium]|nr:hypothetical protein [Alphaproteobacteria bacterium]